jgi:hypothetical protein
MDLNPFEHFPVALAGGQFLQQGVGIESKKFYQVLIGCAVVVVFAILPGESGPAFVEHSCQNHVAA